MASGLGTRVANRTDDEAQLGTGFVVLGHAPAFVTYRPRISSSTLRTTGERLFPHLVLRCGRQCENASKNKCTFGMVRSRGLEPPRVAPLAPQASASTNSATTAG